MPPVFPTIGLMGKPANLEVKSTLESLVDFLRAHHRNVILEEHCATLLPAGNATLVSKNMLSQKCDLVIVVGGDGSLLEAARLLVDDHIPVLGVNRGRRGFLTDISPQALLPSLEPILAGQYQEERRFLLEMVQLRQGKVVQESLALNDIVLHSSQIAKMIEFQVKIDQQFVYRQRSDGIIAATPTGSTAYSLAGGGPIVHPQLDAMILVPMHPPILSSRPIVISSHCTIEWHLTIENPLSASLSADGQVHFTVAPDDTIIIRRKKNELRLLHPMDYDYYHTLRTKLGWAL